MAVGRADLRSGCRRRAFLAIEMVAGEGMPVDRGDVRVRGVGRPPRDPEVGARERLPWDEDTCMSAAEHGHLEVLKWARSNGCPWNEKTCANAASGGHLEILKWARENGCPWPGGTD